MTRKRSLNRLVKHVSDTSSLIVYISPFVGGLATFDVISLKVELEIRFTLIQHLAHEHTSILAVFLQKYISIQISEVQEGIIVYPNNVYIIPSEFNVALLNGILHLLKSDLAHAHRLPIDFFFSSLTKDQHEHAIRIILIGINTILLMAREELTCDLTIAFHSTTVDTIEIIRCLGLKVKTNSHFSIANMNNVIKGAGLTFIDSIEIFQTREELMKVNEVLNLAVVVRDANSAISVQNLNGHIFAWKPRALGMYGWNEAEAC